MSQAFPQAPSELRSMRLLLVDDEMQNIALLRAVLARAGFVDIISTTDPRQVLDLVRREHPDLIALDLNMPYLDGLALLDLLSEELPADDFVPRLVLTADTSSKAQHAALAAGAHDFLTKPFDAFEVALRVSGLLRTRALHLSLEARVASRTADLEQARLELLERLARAAEFRDDDTAEHTVRVGDNAAALARAAGMAADEVEVLRRAAPLHDIGKIGIADAVLLKPGRLDEQEFAHIRTHAQLGADLLAGSSYSLLQLAERIALSHHERWDGSGYPHQLAAEAIPFAARIVALADVYDALTHERPYKPAWPMDQAVEEMARGRGTQFDPHLLDLFLTDIVPASAAAGLA